MKNALKYLTLTLILTLQLSANDSLRLVNPNGGEVFEFGSEIIIKWDRFSTEKNVSIDFSSNSGQTWNEVLDSTKDESYNWRAPFIESDSCLIRIKQVITLDSDVDIIWSKSMGGSNFEYPGTIIQTDDGGFINLSNTASDDFDIPNNKGDRDVWITKLNSNGDVEWTQTYGGQNDDNANSITKTSDNGFLIAGNTSSSDGDVNYNNSAGIHDFWIFKINSNGVIEWSKTYGGTKMDEGISLNKTSDGSLIMVGNSTSTDGDLSETNNRGDKNDIWVLKLDLNGEIEWSKTYGGSEYEYVRSSQPTSDGGIIVTALSESNDGDLEKFGNKGASDAWIFKLNNNGDMEWSKVIGGTESDYVKAGIQSSNGNIFVTGYSRSKDGDFSKLVDIGNEDLWLLKLDSKGNELWFKSFGGSNYDEPKSMILTNDSALIIAGRSSSDDFDLEKPGNKGGGFDAWVLKLNLEGEIEWSNTFGGTNFEEANSVIQTSDGNFIFTGTTMSEDVDLDGAINRGYIDTWILRFTEPVSAPFTDFDISDNFFSIIPHSNNSNFTKLEILHPNGGEEFKANLTDQIKWTGINESTKVRLLFSSNNGESWDSIVDSTSDLSYDWKVPNVYSDSCLIRAEELQSGARIKDLEWVQSFGGSEDDRIYKALYTKDKGFLLVGESRSDDLELELAGNKGQNDIWIYKLNQYGQIEWSKTFGGSLYEFANEVIETENGNFIISGVTSSNDGVFYAPNKRSSDSDIFLMEMNSSGKVLRLKTFGGSKNEVTPHVCLMKNGNYIIAFRTNSIDGDLPLNGIKGMTDIGVFVLNPNWSLEYTRTYGGFHHEFVYDIKEVENEGCMIIGRTESSDGDLKELGFKGYYDTWILKVSNEGILEKSKLFGGRSNDLTNSCIKTKDGGYLLVGYSSSSDMDLELAGNKGDDDVWVMKLNSSLEIEWSKTYGGSELDQAFSCIELNDGNYIISCITSSNDYDFEGNELFGEIDIILLNISKNGDLLWIKNYGGSKGELPLQIMQKNNGNIALAGFHNSTDKLFKHIDIYDDTEYNSFIMSLIIEQSFPDTSDAVFSIVKPDEPDTTYNFGYFVYDNNQSNSATAAVVLYEDTDITIEVYDLLGKRITELYSGLATKGRNEYNIDYNDYQSGRYFVKLTTPKATQTKIIEILW